MSSYVTGEQYGRWTVLGDCASKGRKRYVKCRCECGTVRSVQLCHLKRKASLSCGCLHRELKSNGFHMTHGCARKGLHSPEYRSWEAMLRRVRATEGKHYRDYVLRGITICERWIMFENFLADMGPRPFGTSIDRVNNDGNYEPSNCRWATARQQRLNSRPPTKTNLAKDDF